MTNLTTSCLVFLGLSLSLYATASLLFQGHLWWGHTSWERWGRSTLIVGIAINALGILLHAVNDDPSPRIGERSYVLGQIVILPALRQFAFELQLSAFWNSLFDEEHQVIQRLGDIHRLCLR